MFGRTTHAFVYSSDLLRPAAVAVPVTGGPIEASADWLHSLRHRAKPLVRDTGTRQRVLNHLDVI